MIACGSKGDDDTGGGNMMMQQPGATVTGTCTGTETKACMGTPCSNGQPATATCNGTMFGECMCPTGGGAGNGTPGSGGSTGMMGSGSGGTIGGGDTGGSMAMSTGGTTGGGGTSGNPGTDPEDAWLMMGHDPSNQYNNPVEKTLSVDNASMLTMKWSFMVDGYPTGSPVIADGKVYALSTAGIYAIDLETGMKVWSRTDIMGQSSLAYADGFIYVHTTPGANLWKLNIADGKEVWGPVQTFNHPSADGTSSPIVANGLVMVGHATTAEIVGDGQDTARGGVEAFDTETGMRKWTYFTVPETGENGAMVWSSVSVDKDAGVVFAGVGNNYTVGGPNSDAIHAINIADGTKKWVTQIRQDDVWVLIGTGGGLDTDFGANPILAEVDGKKVVADGDKGSAFWMMDRETGQTIWSRTDLSNSHNMANGGVFCSGAFDGTNFYMAVNQPPSATVLHALDAKTGMDAWAPKNFPATAWGATSVANGLLFAPVGTQLMVFNAKTGDMLTTLETGGTIAAGAAAIAQGKVVVKSGLEYPLDSDTKSNNQIICYGLP